jgi:hypothetical protein
MPYFDIARRLKSIKTARFVYGVFAIHQTKLMPGVIIPGLSPIDCMYDGMIKDLLAEAKEDVKTMSLSDMAKKHECSALHLSDALNVPLTDADISYDKSLTVEQRNIFLFGDGNDDDDDEIISD